MSTVCSENNRRNEAEACRHCGTVIPPQVISISGKDFTVYPMCECYLAEYQKEKTENLRKAKQIELDRFFSQSDFSGHLKHCTIDSFIWQPGTRAALDAARSFIDHLSERLASGAGLILLGGYGNGKTHLAAAIYLKAVELFFPAVFTTLPFLMMRFNRTYHQEQENEYDLLETLIEADLLVIDDVGTEKTSEKNTERLFTLLNGRYNAGRSVIITANFPGPEELLTHLGGRVFDRLLERCQFVVNKARSYRQNLREEKPLNGKSQNVV